MINDERSCGCWQVFNLPVPGQVGNLPPRASVHHSSFIIPNGGCNSERRSEMKVGIVGAGFVSALARIVDVILHDQRAVLTVGAPTPDVVGVRNVTLALPRLVGGQGVLETFPCRSARRKPPASATAPES